MSSSPADDERGEQRQQHGHTPVPPHTQDALPVQQEQQDEGLQEDVNDGQDWTDFMDDVEANPDSGSPIAPSIAPAAVTGAGQQQTTPGLPVAHPIPQPRPSNVVRQQVPSLVCTILLSFRFLFLLGAKLTPCCFLILLGRNVNSFVR
jgi:hypothetical protein